MNPARQAGPFTVEQRQRVREHVLGLARADGRVVAGAVVGSLVDGGGDRWSDLDLTFAVKKGVAVDGVVADWTRSLRRQFDAVHLFDLPWGPTVYRVLMLPGCLQVDLSFTPAAEFRPRGPRFKLLFGKAGQARDVPQQPEAREVFGYGVHYAVHARTCVERGRWWKAEHSISAVRDQALALACLRRGLNARQARGVDELPKDVLKRFEGALVRSPARKELLRALAQSVQCLMRESGEVGELATEAGKMLRGIASAGWAATFRGWREKKLTSAAGRRGLHSRHA